MFLRVFKGLALEDKQGFAIAGDEVWRFEISHRLEVLNAKFNHVEHMRVKNTPKNEVVGSFLLMGAEAEQGAIVLHTLLFELGAIFKGQNFIIFAHQKLRHVGSSHHVDLLEQRVD